MRTGLVLIVLLVAGLFFGAWFFTAQQIQTSSPLPSAAPVMTDVPSFTPAPSDISKLPTKYINAVDWPPEVRVENLPFDCVEAGTETDRAGGTKKVIVNNHTYCVTKVTEGAAGSIYTQYAYARARNNQTEFYTFSLRFVQCGNYAESEKVECEEERERFDVDQFIDQYINQTSAS